MFARHLPEPGGLVISIERLIVSVTYTDWTEESNDGVERGMKQVYRVRSSVLLRGLLETMEQGEVGEGK